MINVIDQLVSFFNKEGWPLDINEIKLRDRTQIADGSYKPGWQIVEIERHRGVLGSNYYQGCQMNAFQTYWMCYAVYQKTGVVEKLQEKAGEITVNLNGLISEHLDIDEFNLITIEPYGEDVYEIEYQIINERRRINSLKQAISFGLESVPSFGRFFKEGLDLFNVSEDYMDELCTSYKKLIEEEITQIMIEKWEEAENMNKDYKP